MKKCQLTCSSSSPLLLVLLLSFSIFSVSYAAPLSSIVNVTPFVEDIITCLQSSSTNASSISQLIFTPANASFLPIWAARANNNRFNRTETPKPSLIVTPVDETQVRSTLLCTKKHGYELRIRCGGHDFEGLSYTADVPFVMLDLVNMRSVDVDVENRTAVAQGGAVLGRVYYDISQKTDSLYFPGGLCPTVGVGGYIGGGGYGILIRKYGTPGDNVVDVRFMDVNGNIHDRKSMGEDLFWAVRGGSAASFGIVLSWKLSLVPVPERVTVFLRNITLEENATEIFHKFQYVIPKNVDRNVLIRVSMSSEYIGNTTKKTIRMLFYGLYLGSPDALLSLLDRDFPELNVTREICREVRMVEASLFFGTFPANTSTEVLSNRTSLFTLNTKDKLDYVKKPIPVHVLKKMWQKVFENDFSEALIMHSFGGRNEDISETAIPYPHRAGVLYQFHQSITFNGQASPNTPVSLRRLRWLRSFNDFVTPYVSKNPRERFRNYVDLDLGVLSRSYAEASVWGEKYWKRDNFKKLIRVKGEVDPENFFRFPQSIPVLPDFSESRSDI